MRRRPPRSLLAGRARRGLAERRDDRERATAEGALFQLFAPRDELSLEHPLHLSPPRLGERRSISELPGERPSRAHQEGRAPGREPGLGQPRLDRREHARAVLGGFVSRAEAVGLVDEDLDREPGGGARFVQDPALALLHRLAGVEEPDRGVRFVEGAARRVRVPRVGGVEARGIEDLDAGERGDRQENLDPPDVRRVDRLEDGAKVEDGRDSLGWLGPRAEEDPGDRVRAIAEMVERRGGGEDPHRGDLLADERVDEGALAGVELPDDGEAQRPPALGGEACDPGARFEVVEGAGDLLEPREEQVPARRALRRRPGASQRSAERRAPRDGARGGEGRELVEQHLAALASPARRLRRSERATSRRASRSVGSSVDAALARRASIADGERERCGVPILERRVPERALGSSLPGTHRLHQRGARLVAPPVGAREGGTKARELRLAARLDDAPHARARGLVAGEPAERRRQRLARARRVEDIRAQERGERGWIGAQSLRAPEDEARATVRRVDFDPRELRQRSVGVPAREAHLCAAQRHVGRAIARRFARSRAPRDRAPPA